MINEVFENFGGIVSIRKGKKNFAHIRYDTEDCVDRSLFLSGKVFIKLICKAKL